MIPSRLVQLSLTAARSILGKNITCDNDVLLEKIQQLLQQETLFKGTAILWVNPDDMALVQDNVGKSRRRWAGISVAMRNLAGRMPDYVERRRVRRQHEYPLAGLCELSL